MKRRHLLACAAAALTLAAAAAAVGPAAHAQGGAGSGELPAWIKSIFVFYADGQIGDRELIGALEYLIGAGIIQVSAPAPAAPVMSAEAISYELDAEAVEQWSIESRQAAAELMDVVYLIMGQMDDDEYEAWEPRAEALGQIIYDMNLADAALIAALRAAAADGQITSAERADVDSATIAANDAGDRANAAILDLTPEMQAALYGPDMAAFMEGLFGGAGGADGPP